MLQVLHRTTPLVASVGHVDFPCCSAPEAAPRCASSVDPRRHSALSSFADPQRSYAAQLLALQLISRLVQNANVASRSTAAGPKSSERLVSFPGLSPRQSLHEVLRLCPRSMTRSALTPLNSWLQS
ncbi:hypothetical protein MTO96_022748 [Rhipicephalus appendiculatus]